jgi:excisionase family DNA binding protein
MAELLTLEEVAEYLRVTQKTIYRMVTKGSIPATKVGHQWRFNKASVDNWLNERDTGTKAKILVVDDEELVRMLFEETLNNSGHKVVTAGSSVEGLKWVNQQDFDLAFLDLKMPMMDGAELFRQIRAIKPKMPVIIITGYPDSDIMSRALAEGPFGVMKKPFGVSDIDNAVDMFIRSEKSS